MTLHRPSRLALSTLALAVLAAVPACDDAASQTCDVVSPAFRKLGANGVSLNGVSLNGSNMQGVSLNGISLNGRKTQGASLNGISLNGVVLNGVELNGVSLNGISLNGDELEGLALGEIALVGTSLVAMMPDGAQISGDAWVGATMRASLGDALVDLEIGAVQREGDVEWYSLLLDGAPICENRGLFLAGVWDETGARHDALDDASFAYSFACDTGALAKCVDWGYAPHTAGADAHQSCTRMVRADYCGDGISHTADGTTIDVFDPAGVQVTDPTATDLVFEAGWGPDGAVCVSRPRYEEISTSGDVIVPECWDALPSCEAPTVAYSMGAKVVNRSAEQSLCYGG